MDVNLFMRLKAPHQLLRLLQREVKWVRVRPGEECCISLCIEVAECVRKLDLKVPLIVPGQGPLAPLPLHWVGADSVDGPKSHLVKLTLRGHAPNIEGQRLPILCSLHAEVKPRVIVALLRVWQPVARHVASVRVLSTILSWIALAQVAWVKLTGNDNAPRQLKRVLRWLTVVHHDIISELIRRLAAIAASLTRLSLLYLFSRNRFLLSTEWRLLRRCWCCIDSRTIRLGFIVFPLLSVLICNSTRVQIVRFFISLYINESIG